MTHLTKNSQRAAGQAKLVLLLLLLVVVATVLFLIKPNSQQNKPPIQSIQTITQYGKMCEDMIGEIPVFDCNDGTVVPITVEAETPESYTPRMTCDKPSMLPYGEETFGQCTPYSKVLDLSQGSKQISAFCRREYLRDEDSVFYDEVDIILHNVDTGNTCWFHAATDEGNSKGFDASRVPPPAEVTPPAGHVSAMDFWWSPAKTATLDCGGCHDADPFMFSPYIGQVWHKVPTDPFGWYKNIGEDFTGWQAPETIHIEDNTCVGCHRIGNQKSCELVSYPLNCEGNSCQTMNVIRAAAGQDPVYEASQAGLSYPLSHWMPVDNFHSKAFWDNVYLKSVEQLLTCCETPDHPMCEITSVGSLSD